MNKKSYKLYYPNKKRFVKQEEEPRTLSRKEINIDDKKDKIIRVGLLDLGAWLSNLNELVNSYNKIQKDFLFYEIDTPLPTGLISRPERLIDWAHKLKWQFKKHKKEELKKNIIANDYYKIVQEINAELKLDFIIGITPFMVARWIRKEKKIKVQFNLFSTYSSNAILVSSYQLREFTKKTGFSFESFLTAIIFTQLLVAMFFPKLFYHDDNGCFFDHNEVRSNIINKVKNPIIEDECWENIPNNYHKAVKAILKLITKQHGNMI